MADIEVGPEGRQAQTSLFSRFMSIAAGVLFLPVLVVGISSAPSCMGFGEPALAAVNACPAATAALGTPIAQSWMGISCGNAETEDDDGSASWSMPVAGPSGRGSLDIAAVERGGHWRFRSLVLSAAGHTIDIVACAAGGTGDMTPIAHRVVTGTATTIVGEPGVVSGAACTVTLDPSEGTQTCRVGIVCGARTLYGGGSGGYGHCSTDASGAITMRDGNPSTVDGDPMLDLRLGAHEVVVTDQGRDGAWVATITTAP